MMVQMVVRLFLQAVASALLLVTCASAPTWKHLDDSYTFEQYQLDFGKKYDSPEEQVHRRGIFERHLEQILHHNSRDNVAHFLGVNKFTDQEPEELFFGYDKSGRQGWSANLNSVTLSSRRKLGSHRVEIPFDIDHVSTLPPSIDWREKNVVTPVKDQGGCGSCWAFASTAVLESHIALETEILFSLSTQELVSCVPNPRHCGGSGGCAGATAELAYDFVAADGNGIVQEWQFGYESYYGHTGDCSKIQTSRQTLRGHKETDQQGIRGAVATIEGYAVLPSNNYTVLMNAVAKAGPLVVSVAASGWFAYEKGVFSDKDKSAKSCDLNHAVVLVGYGTDEETKEDYWLIRNSWSPKWGENGYIRLKRTDPSTLDNPETDCGMDVTPGHGDACTEDDSGNPIVPPAVKVCGTSGILFDSVVPVGARLL